jgi:GT2 family glycosyltransferase
MDSARIAVISVCMNDGAVLPQFIENIRKWDAPQYHHIFVDNGSSDSSICLLRRHFPDATIVESSVNVGTTGAYNIGIRVAQAKGIEYIQFLAVDTLLAPICLRTLVAEMERCPQIGAIGPILFKSHDKRLVECMGFKINKDWTFHPCYGGRREPLNFPDMLDVDYIDGGSALFRASALAKTGLLNEQLFMYGEDVDICLCLKRKGYRVIATGKARCWHRHSEIRRADPRPRPYQVFYEHRNQFYLARRNKDRIDKSAFYLGLLKRLPRKIAYFVVREHSSRLAWIYLESLWNGLNCRMGKTKYVQ